MIIFIIFLYNMKINFKEYINNVIASVLISYIFIVLINTYNLYVFSIIFLISLFCIFKFKIRTFLYLFLIFINLWILLYWQIILLYDVVSLATKMSNEQLWINMTIFEYSKQVIFEKQMINHLAVILIFLLLFTTFWYLLIKNYKKIKKNYNVI
jgi:hypothetical protein